MQRIIDIASNDCRLSKHRGFLQVSRAGEELGRVALDDIGGMIIHGHGTSLSANILTALADREVITVLCGSNHMPHSMVLPLVGHHMQGARMIAQAGAKSPLKKQLWKSLIVLKIQMQARVLDAVGAPLPAIADLARKVRSGDPDNIEARAARRYWPQLMGSSFTRDRAQPGANGLLNYGYIVLRAACARALVASGLNPSLGIHHHAGPNNAALADDIMEPFRPFIDLAVWHLTRMGYEDVEPPAKRALAGLLDIDLMGPDGASPLGVCIRRAAQSLASSFEAATPQLILPDLPTPLQLGAIRELVNDHASR